VAAVDMRTVVNIAAGVVLGVAVLAIIGAVLR
jgi:hypothetical protein